MLPNCVCNKSTNNFNTLISTACSCPGLITGINIIPGALTSHWDSNAKRERVFHRCTATHQKIRPWLMSSRTMHVMDTELRENLQSQRNIAEPHTYSRAHSSKCNIEKLTVCLFLLFCRATVSEPFGVTSASVISWKITQCTDSQLPKESGSMVKKI